MRTLLSLLAGVLIGCAVTGGYVAVSGGWYEYKMLNQVDCILFKIGQFNPGSWHVAPQQPNECYLRRSRIGV